MEIDKHKLIENFARVSASYETEAVLQQTVLGRLLERLDYLKADPLVILDMGSGPGVGTLALEKRFPQSSVMLLDITREMLLRSRARKKLWQKKPVCICADQEQIPLKNESMDLVFSSLSVQWSPDFSSLSKEVARILRPDGLFVFSSLGPNTLWELKDSWLAVDGRPHVNAFHDIRDMGDDLINAHFSDPVLDSEVITLTYEQPLEMLRDLKRVGVTNVQTNRFKGLTGKTALKKFISAYEDHRDNGRLPASYEVIYGHAWRSQLSSTGVDKFVFPLEGLSVRK